MIVIASDHAGFELKEKIKKYFEKQNIKFFDVGAIEVYKNDSYVLYGKNAIKYYVDSCDTDTDKLILICGSGIGMSIVANRNEKIRAVLAYSKKQAVQGRQHNNCNCLCIGGRNTNFLKAKGIIKAFLETNFLGGKHLDRINSIWWFWTIKICAWKTCTFFLVWK